jgi:hypothetical protein
MARVAQRQEFWAMVVAEAQAGGQTLEQVATKHGVTEAALKYHLYKVRRAKAPAGAPRVLPIRVERQSAVVEAQFGSVRVSFCDSCEPAYVAAVLGLVLYYKRLEKGRFRMPRVTADGRAVEMDATELAMLLDGIDVRYVRRAEHWQPKKAGERAQGIDKTIAV